MKKILLAILVIFSYSGLSAQDSIKPNPEVLELRMQLIQARLQLIGQQIDNLSDIPQYYSGYILFLDSVMAAQRDSIRMLGQAIEAQRKVIEEPLHREPVRGIIHMDPARLFEGTFQMGYETMISPTLSLDAAFLGTYVTRYGLGGGYLSSNDFEFLDPVSNEYYNYNGDMLKGLGMTMRLKSFLGPDYRREGKTPPMGFYAGPQLLYRHVVINGYMTDYVNGTYQQTEVTQNLDVVSFGAVIGGRFTFLKVFSCDIHLGGLMRLSTYANEKGLTRYKRWTNIDYSGVMPNAGLTIGVLR